MIAAFDCMIRRLISRLFVKPTRIGMIVCNSTFLDRGRVDCHVANGCISSCPPALVRSNDFQGLCGLVRLALGMDLRGVDSDIRSCIEDLKMDGISKVPNTY